MLVKRVICAWIGLGLFLLASTAVPSSEEVPHEIGGSAHREGYVDANGVRLQYLDWGGTGPVLILLQGLLDNPHVFDDLAPAFVDRFHVIAYARRGSGRSEVKAPYDAETLMKDLEGLMDGLGIAKANLAGWSMGGTEITWLAVKHPERVDNIVYLDSYDLTDHGYQVAAEGSPPHLGEQPAEATASLASYLSYEKEMSYPGLHDLRRVEGYLREQVIVQPDGSLKPRLSDDVQRALLATMRADHRDYTKVKAPVLAIFALSVYDSNAHDVRQRELAQGWENRYWTPFRKESIERMRREIPGAKIICVQGSHRAFFLTSRTEVVTAMRRFLIAGE